MSPGLVYLFLLFPLPRTLLMSDLCLIVLSSTMSSQFKYHPLREDLPDQSSLLLLCLFSPTTLMLNSVNKLMNT